MRIIKRVFVVLIIYFVSICILNNTDIGAFPIGTLFFAAISIAFIFAGIILHFTKYKKQKQILFLLGVISILALTTSFLQTRIKINSTEIKAAKIIEALELYKNSTGGYPKELSFLVPRYTKEIPQPTFHFVDSFIYEVEHINHRVDTTHCEYYKLIYYGPLGMRAEYSSKNCQWEYYD